MKTQMSKLFPLTAVLLLLLFACQKEKDLLSQKNGPVKAVNNPQRGHPAQKKTFCSEVVIILLNMQLNMLRVPLPAGVAAPDASRALAYCGIALYEAVEPGMPAYQSLSGQLNQLPGMPATEPGQAYHWAASANAALAYMNRQLFPLASTDNKAAMDTLESQLQNQYAAEVDAECLLRSIDFGRAVAQIVFDWAQTDGAASMPAPSTYNIPVGPGLWEKTPPNFAGPANPFSSMRRYIVSTSNENTGLTPPPVYSTDPTSDFYAMVADVSDKSFNLTPTQTDAAFFHRDAPGYPGGGSLVAMLAQALQQSGVSLDKAALAYSKLGIASHDAILNCFIVKYTVNLVRPITYIRNVMNQPAWNALFATPGHPEFPSAHAVNGGAISTMLTDVLGGNFNLTLNHYAYLNLPARNYSSFDELGREMGDSRVWAGIHYQESCDKGFWLGQAVSENILNKVKFLKD